MVPVLQFQFDLGKCSVVGSPMAEVAWMNQATWHHCHFGLKSAPGRRDFRPEKEEVIN
jgi:hypothetical protein